MKPDPTLEQRIEDLKAGMEKALQHLLENDPPSLARITLQQTLNKDKPW